MMKPSKYSLKTADAQIFGLPARLVHHLVDQQVVPQTEKSFHAKRNAAALAPVDTSQYHLMLIATCKCAS